LLHRRGRQSRFLLFDIKQSRIHVQIRVIEDVIKLTAKLKFVSFSGFLQNPGVSQNYVFREPDRSVEATSSI
jgi:hypothetical protein